VKDSGMEYIKAFKKSFKGTIINNARIKTIIRNDKITIILNDSEKHVFDKIVMATHADKALPLFEKPSEDEKNILGAFKYDYYPFVVHTYDKYLKTKAMSHFFVNNEDNNYPVSWHVGISLYKKLKTEKDYFWSSNSPFDIPKSHIVHENSTMRLPLFTFESLKKQPLLSSLNGKLDTYYCGSYFFDGNHECSIQSAIEVGKKFGINL
jgi:predicted NAD/FAD-binding protein